MLQGMSSGQKHQESLLRARIILFTLENTTERLVGSVTIDNERYGRYQGEMQIAKRNLPMDEKVNVVGRVIDEDLSLLKYIKSGQGFSIIDSLID